MDIWLSLELEEEPYWRIMTYRCRNCMRETKTYALLFSYNAEQDLPKVTKLAELPKFGDRVPDEVLGLFGKDRELFLKGKTAENAGLGIASFTYYRRVVTSHKAQLFDALIKAAESAGADQSFVDTLKAARDTWEFSKSVEQIKDAIPDRLKLAGRNPLVLLHEALSYNIHEKSDDECLELAQAIRAVLTKLAERIKEVSQDEADLKDHITRLERTRKERAEKRKLPEVN